MTVLYIITRLVGGNNNVWNIEVCAILIEATYKDF